MAQRFFFDLTDGRTTIRDEEGALAATLEEAIKRAEEVLEEMHRGKELSRGDEAWTLIIRGDADDILATLPVVPRDPAAALAS